MEEDWAPQHILFQIAACATNSLAVQVETDQGVGYLKAMSDQTDPADLVCDLIGTRLARHFGLTVPDFAIIDVPEHAPVVLARNAHIRPGPAFISRRVSGEPLATGAAGLGVLSNPQDLAKLVAFDTWTVNCDRYRPRSATRERRANYGNLMLSRDNAPKGQFVLMPIDHGCCFRCQSDLTPPTLRRATTEETLYGLFPEFRERVLREDALRSARELQSLTGRAIHDVLDGVPSEWDFPEATRTALFEMLTQRQPRMERIIRDRFPSADLFDLEDVERETP